MTNKKRKSSIGEILASVSPKEAKRIENRMLIASKIDEAMKTKSWKKKDLMHAVGKANPSEITRWLSGTHNFTIDTLTDLCFVLGVDLLNLEERQEPVIHRYNLTVSVTSKMTNNCYENTLENSQLYFEKTATLSN
ncbi:MAG: helix-turn-helix transcriptional regulator [Bacteroidales bacterium]|jgi:DNA-binding Xre family transcriptional regulator|nr:helix-turn-helix transcriptional regulator [Bacteroidales bacterium]